MRRLANIALLIFATTGSASCWAQRSAAGTAGPAAANDVEFRSGEVTISGTVVFPPNNWAAVFIVQGSGRLERNIGFAKWLASQGVAALTYDKRGVGKSGGVYAEVDTENTDPQNLKLLAGDAAAAVGELTRRLPKDTARTSLTSLPTETAFDGKGWSPSRGPLRFIDPQFFV